MLTLFSRLARICVECGALMTPLRHSTVKYEKGSVKAATQAVFEPFYVVLAQEDSLKRFLFGLVCLSRSLYDALSSIVKIAF